MSWHSDVDLDLDIGFGSGPLAASPTWTDVSTDIRSMTINRGRSSISQSFPAGTMTVTLDNRDGDYDPNNSSSPHSPNLKLGTPVRVQATYNMTTYDLFYGHISRWPLNYPMSGKDAIAVIECTENLGLLRSGRLLAQSYSVELTGTRIGNILDDASWPAGARSIAVGSADCAAITYSGDAGQLIADTVEAEQGSFFMAKNGDATFLARTQFSGVSPVATFDPGTNLDYAEVSVLYDDDELINIAEITAASGAAQSDSDATSITEHGEHAYANTNDSVFDANSAFNVANWLVDKRKEVASRVTGLSIHPQEDPTSLWPEVLDRELQDLITVKVDPPGAGTNLDQDVAIQSIQHSITPGSWVVSYVCHPVSSLETTSYWVLGTSELDTGTVLA